MLLNIISAIFFGAATFMLAGYVYQWRQGRLAHRHLLRRETKSFDSIIIRLLLPLIENISPYLGRIRLDRYYSYVTENIVRSGLDDKLKAAEVFTYQCLMSFIIALLYLLLLPKFSLPVFVFAAALGFGFPLLWLKSLSRKRSREISYSLPQVLDLLSLSVEAGLDFMSAVGRIVEKSANSTLIMELGRMLNRIKLGKSRAEALTEFRRRLTHPDIDSFVGMLLQAERLGASIGPILKAQAEKLRSDRFQRAERAGAVAAEKLLVPLIFCIMPAVFIVVFGPILVMWRAGYFERMFQ